MLPPILCYAFRFNQESRWLTSNAADTHRMAEQIRADPEKICTVEINERTTKKQAKKLPAKRARARWTR